MKTKLLYSLFLYFGLFLQTNKAQSYTPFPDSNAVWNVLELTMGYPSDTTKSQTKLYGLINDTIINSIEYSKLYFNNGLIDSTIQIASPNTSYLCAIRQDTLLKKVYFIPKDSINELIFYDFSINAGDTFFVYNEIGNKVKAWCIGRGPYLVSGKIRNTFDVKSENTLWGWHTLIEGVGNMRGLFETFYNYSSNKAVMCLTVNDSLYYKFDGNPIWDIIIIDTSTYKSCYNNGMIITGNTVLENSKNAVAIFPNPFLISTLVTIPKNLKLNNITLDIFDIQGKKIKEFHALNDNKLILYREDFNSRGVYFIRIKSDNYIETIKLLVQ